MRRGGKGAWIDCAIEAGELRDYADASRPPGLSRARVAQLAALFGLPAAQQEAHLRRS